VGCLNKKEALPKMVFSVVMDSNERIGKAGVKIGRLGVIRESAHFGICLPFRLR
jgi:hypothetical protein